MKLLIASDLHGSSAFCRLLAERIDEESPDRIILLGDLLYHGPRNALPEEYETMAAANILNKYKEKIIAVRGNCDSEVDQMVLDFPCFSEYTTLLLEDGTEIFATHGHHWDPGHLPPMPSGSIFMYGHTHKKIAQWQDDIFIFNPGSVSIPKDGSNSYAIFEDGIFYMKDLYGEIISKCEFNKAHNQTNN